MEQPTNYNEQVLSFEDQEIKRLKAENATKQLTFNKNQEIERLKVESNRIDAQSKDMQKRFNPKFNFTKEKAKFWAIAVVIAITVAIVIVKIAQKLF